MISEIKLIFFEINFMLELFVFNVEINTIALNLFFEIGDLKFLAIFFVVYIFPEFALFFSFFPKKFTKL